MSPEAENQKKLTGERFRSARDHLGLTQADAAKRVGLSKQAVSEWERGRSSPSLDQVMKILDGSDLSPMWVLTGDGEMEGGRQSEKRIVLGTGGPAHEGPITVPDLSPEMARALDEAKAARTASEYVPDVRVTELVDRDGVPFGYRVITHVQWRVPYRQTVHPDGTEEAAVPSSRTSVSPEGA